MTPELSAPEADDEIERDDREVGRKNRQGYARQKARQLIGPNLRVVGGNADHIEHDDNKNDAGVGISKPSEECAPIGIVLDGCSLLPIT